MGCWILCELKFNAAEEKMRAEAGDEKFKSGYGETFGRIKRYKIGVNLRMLTQRQLVSQLLKSACSIFQAETLRDASEQRCINFPF